MHSTYPPFARIAHQLGSLAARCVGAKERPRAHRQADTGQIWSPRAMGRVQDERAGPEGYALLRTRALQHPV
jgi:hypothetical protein